MQRLVVALLAIAFVASAAASPLPVPKANTDVRTASLPVLPFIWPRWFVNLFSAT